MDTAIEWLELQFEKYTRGGVQVPNEKIFKLTEKAKQKEKEQIRLAFREGHEYWGELTSDMYYDQIYNKNK